MLVFTLTKVMKKCRIDVIYRNNYRSFLNVSKVISGHAPNRIG